VELRRAIVDDYGRRLRFAQLAEKGGYTLLLTTKYEPDVVKSDRDNDVTKWRFSIFCEEPIRSDYCFLFPVGHQLNRSTCSGDVFGNAYLWFGERSKIVRKQFCTFLA